MSIFVGKREHVEENGWYDITTIVDLGACTLKL